VAKKSAISAESEKPSPIDQGTSSVVHAKETEAKDSQSGIMSAARIKAMANTSGHKGPSLADVVTAQLSSQIAHTDDTDAPKAAPRRKKPSEPEQALDGQVEEPRPTPVKLPGLADLGASSTADAEASRKPRPNATAARSGPVPLPRKPAAQTPE
jgi:hypothetical protein